MAPSLSDGVPGLEGLHTLTPPGFTAFTLNDWMSTSTGRTKQWTDATAHTWLTGITGIHDKPEDDDPRVKLIYQQGELPLPRFQRGRTITYSGIVVGETLSAMRAKVAALREACAMALTNPSAWYVQVVYDSTYDTTGLTFKGWGVPTAFTCDDVQGAPTLLPSAFQRPFQLTFRQSEGRWWVTSDEQSAGSSGSPIADGSSGTLTMPGTAPGEPVFTVYGTGSGESQVVITHSEIGWTLTINLPHKLADGDTLEVDFGDRSVTYTPVSGAVLDWTGYLDWTATNAWDEASSAWTVTPGGSLVLSTNTLTVSGDTWAVTALPAVW